MAFAKLFGGNEAKDEEQIVVLLKSGDDGPEVRFYFNPGGDFGVCNITMKFSDSDDGWDAAEAWMKTVKESDARELVDRTRENLLQASPGDDGGEGCSICNPEQHECLSSPDDADNGVEG